MSKVHFVTFGCDNFKLSRQRLANEAKDSGWFDKIFVYTPADLLLFTKGFENRGAGYWWWKATVQLLALSKIPDGDLILYLDSGFYINKYAKNIFDQYVDIVTKNAGFLAFSCHLGIEKNWTKRDLFKLLECDLPEYTETDQIASGLVLYKKNELSIKFLKEYQAVSFIDHALNDHPSYNENYEGFIEHRHDQSVFGLLVKKIYKNYNIELVKNYKAYEDEIELVRKWMMDKNTTGIEDLKHPFLATRIRDYPLLMDST